MADTIHFIHNYDKLQPGQSAVHCSHRVRRVTNCLRAEYPTVVGLVKTMIKTGQVLASYRQFE
eukprot:scaffold269639_cov14-Tisochrysis_lutea.AAC.1